MSAKIEANGSDACLGQAFGQSGHGNEIFTGENAMHEDDHGTMVCLRIEALRKAYLEGYTALWAANVEFFRSEGEYRQ